MAEKLKIAVITKSFNLSGGMERYAVEVAQGLSERGHEIDIFTREADKELLAGMGCVYLPQRYSFSSVLSAAALAWDISVALAGGGYDIIHSHERAYCQDVLTNHCFSYKGSLKKYSFLRRIDQKFLSPRSWLYLYLEKKQMQTRRLVAVSKALQRDIEENYKLCKNISVICPGVETEIFKPTEMARRRAKVRRDLHIQKDEKVVLFVGSEFKRKGLDLVIRAMKNKDIRLLVVGRGDKLNCRRLVEENGLADKVIFIGLSSDVVSFYSAADMVVLPSRSEAFGMSVLEGMSCGLAVAVSNNSGAADLIEDGKNGFLLKSPTDLEQLFANFPDKAKLEKIGYAARQTAECYSWQKVTDQYENLFYEIFSNK